MPRQSYCEPINRPSGVGNEISISGAQRRDPETVSRTSYPNLRCGGHQDPQGGSGIHPQNLLVTSCGGSRVVRRGCYSRNIQSWRNGIGASTFGRLAMELGVLEI